MMEEEEECRAGERGKWRDQISEIERTRTAPGGGCALGPFETEPLDGRNEESSAGHDGQVLVEGNQIATDSSLSSSLGGTAKVGKWCADGARLLWAKLINHHIS